MFFFKETERTEDTVRAYNLKNKKYHAFTKSYEKNSMLMYDYGDKFG